MADRMKLWLIAAMFLAMAGACHAATLPADPCSLLQAADVSKTLGGSYGAPSKTVAPRPYANTAEGTDCHYQGGGSELLFRIYFDPSPGDATSLFAKLKIFYSPATPVPGLGDEAYLDPGHGLHVRKGNVRYFLSGAGTDQQLTALGQLVAGKL